MKSRRLHRLSDASRSRPPPRTGACDYFAGSPNHGGVIRGEGGLRHGAMPSLAQSKLYEGLLPVEPSVEAVRPTDPKNDPSPSGWPLLGKLAPLAFARYQIAFFVGVAATLAWQSYGEAAREMIANSYPQLGWVAPQPAPTAQNAADVVALALPTVPSPEQQQLNAISLDAVRQSIDRIATGIAAGQEQITRTVDRIATSVVAGQDQMTREISKLQAVEQYVLYKNSEPPPRPSPAPARKPVPVPQPSQAPTVR
jgi:hypothetical protein